MLKYLTQKNSHSSETFFQFFCFIQKAQTFIIINLIKKMVLHKKFITLFLVGIFILCTPARMSSQVTIGNAVPASSYSLCDLNTEHIKKGLHLPRLTTESRDLLVRQDMFDAYSARGLMIFNETTSCVEIWNGFRWISICNQNLIVKPPSWVFAHGGGINTFEVETTHSKWTVSWITATGETTTAPIGFTLGAPNLENNTFIVTADNNTGAERGGFLRVKAGSLFQDIPIEQLSQPPIILSDNVHVTAFVNVMYDFQSQRFETFVSGGAMPQSWQWQVSTDNENWTNILGAFGTSFTTTGSIRHERWLFPANFIHNVLTPNAAGDLYFRTVITYNDGTRFSQLTTNTLQIHFIQTTHTGNNDFLPGFGMDSNGVRWADMSRTPQSSPFPTRNIIRVALLNLGTDEYNGCLGSLFQWGRRADGHQQIGWFNDPNTRASTFTSGDSERGTSDVFSISSPPVAPPANQFNRGNPDGTGDGQPNSQDLARRFITVNATTNPVHWITGVTGDAFLHLWGSNSQVRSGQPADLAAWAFRDNNPCPAGWRIPSIYEWNDMHAGDGISSERLHGTWGAQTPRNTNNWGAFRPTRAGAVGGALVRNTATGAAVFFPAAGRRAHSSSPAGTIIGGPADVGVEGSYWSSTRGASASGTRLFLSNDALRTGAVGTMTSPVEYEPNNLMVSRGFSVRCVYDGAITPQWEPIPLTVAAGSLPAGTGRVSTNAQDPSEGDIRFLIDGNPNTFFHTRWSIGNFQMPVTTNASHQALFPAEPHYIQIDFGTNQVSGMIRYEFVTRITNLHNDGDVLGMRVEGSNNGTNWTLIATHDFRVNGQPYPANLTGQTTISSPNMMLPGSGYRYLRFTPTHRRQGGSNSLDLINSAQWHNRWFHMSGLFLYRE